MPKLLQINSTVNKGSAGRIVEQIGRLSIENGWESFIAYGRASNKSESVVLKIGTKFDLYRHGFFSLFFDMHGLSSNNATRKLISNIETIKPDVIHLHGLHGYYINYNLLFNYLNNQNIPIVWTMHDFWAVTGHCTYFTDVGCLKWITACYECPKQNNYPKSIIFDRSAKNFQLKKKLFNQINNLVVVSVSNWMEALLKQSFLSKYTHKIITNAVDINTLIPSNKSRIIQKHKSFNKFIILGVAISWDERKGWDDYITLSKILPSDYQIIMVGLSEILLKKLPSNIIGVKRTESISELAEYYSAADVVLSLSSQETFGMTTIEGFACGTPGIVYNCTASPELITPETGFIVEKGDFSQLVQAIYKINELGKDFYSANCRRRAIEFYNAEKRYMEYINLYDSLLKNN